jgi:hypothetical protein
VLRLVALSPFVLLGACGSDAPSAAPADGGLPEVAPLVDASSDAPPADSFDGPLSDVLAPDAPVDGAAKHGEAWVWAWTQWAASLGAIASHASSFTHVSPALYSVNYAYASGVAYYSTCPMGSTNDVCLGPGADSFDGMTSTLVAQQINSLGLACVPLIFGGAGNSGTDKGITNILDDVSGAQGKFITAMVGEARAKGYAGYNLDWEVGPSTGNAFASKLVTFVDAFKAQLAPYGMSLSIDLIGSNVQQTFCSGPDGYADLQKLGASSIDRIFLEDYETSLGTASTACRPVPNPAPCPGDVLGFFDLMCTFVPPSKVGIGLESSPSATNPVAGKALSAMHSYGFDAVAVWPASNIDGPGGSYLFLDDVRLAPSGTWFTLLAQFLMH